MQFETFVGRVKTYDVRVRGASGLTREYVWMRSVGSMLRSLRPAKTPNEIFMEYQAAGVGSRRLVAVMREITRAKVSRDGNVQFTTRQRSDEVSRPIVFISRESIAVIFVRQSKHTGTT